jgi:hypothetical protein
MSENLEVYLQRAQEIADSLAKHLDEADVVLENSDSRYADDVSKIIALIETNGIQKSFDIFIGDENEASKYERKYARDKYDAILDFVKVFNGTYESVKEYVDEHLKEEF